MIVWGFIYLAYICLAGLSLVENARGAAYPEIISAFGIDTRLGAWIFTISCITGLTTNFSSRMWLSKWGAKKSTQMALLFIGSGAIAMAISAHVGSFAFLLASSGMIGIGTAMAIIAMNILIIEATSLAHRRRFYSGLHAIYGLAALFSPIAFAKSMDRGLPWYVFFLFVGGLSLFCYFTTLFIAKSDSKIEVKKIAANVPFKIRSLYGLVISFYVSSEVIIASRLTLLLQDEFRYPMEQSKFYLSGFFFFLMIGRLFLAAKHFNMSNETLLKFSLGATLVISTLGLLLHPLFLPLMGLSMSYFFPVAMNYLSDSFKDKTDFVTTSVMTLMEVILIIVNLSFGYLIQYLGIKISFYLVPLFIFLSLLTLYFIKWTISKQDDMEVGCEKPIQV